MKVSSSFFAPLRLIQPSPVIFVVCLAAFESFVEYFPCFSSFQFGFTWIRFSFWFAGKVDHTLHYIRIRRGRTSPCSSSATAFSVMAVPLDLALFYISSVHQCRHHCPLINTFRQSSIGFVDSRRYVRTFVRLLPNTFTLFQFTCACIPIIHIPFPTPLSMFFAQPKCSRSSKVLLLFLKLFDFLHFFY